MSQARPVPVVTAAQMAAVDRAMVDVCGLDLMQVMETAGRAVAIVARHLLGDDPRDPVAILCGSGGNGGDGFVCGRYLAGWGYDVEHRLARPSCEYHGLAAHQLEICHKIGLTVHEPDAAIDFANTALIVDGLLGFGLNVAPAGHAARLIEAANASPAPILAIDIPSGIDATTGSALGPAIRADLTMTLALPKLGLIRDVGPIHAGNVVVADIGIPAAAYAAAGIASPAVYRTTEFVNLDGTPYRFGR
jgi:NAD(P)H-hydrate epimerase